MTILGTAARPWTVIDPSDSDICRVPGAVTASDPLQVDLDAEVSRFVPKDPADQDAFDVLYSRLYEAGGPRMVMTDEARFIFPASGCKPGPRRFIIQGRKRQLGHIACDTRAKQVYLELLAAMQLFVFPGMHGDDVEAIARTIGMSFAQLQAQLASCPPFGFLWYQRRPKELICCPPLPRELLR